MENLTGGTPPVRYLPCVVPCKLYFTGVEEIDSIFNNFFSVLFGIIRVAGVVLLVFGIYQTFQSSHAQDSTGRIQGVFMLGGGLVAVFLREILGFLGIAV